MRMTACKSGHYYDAGVHASCPYCTDMSVDNITKKPKGEGMGTKATEVANNSSNQTEFYQTEERVQGDNNQTVYMDADGEEVKAKSNLLLSGWLAVISEDGRGASHTLTFGMNTIGRDRSNHIHINNKDNSISREKHAIIIYDYQNNIFFIKHGDGQYLSYLNDEVLLDNKELKANDKIKIGNTELIFIPLCSEHFSWEQ